MVLGLNPLYSRMRAFMQTYTEMGSVNYKIVEVTEEVKAPSIIQTFDTATYEVEGEEFPRMKVVMVVGFEMKLAHSDLIYMLVDETSKFFKYKLVLTPLRYSTVSAKLQEPKIGQVPYSQIYFNTLTSKLACHQSSIPPVLAWIKSQENSYAYLVDCFLLTENYFSLYYRLEIDGGQNIEYEIKRVTNALPEAEPLDVEMNNHKVIARLYRENSQELFILYYDLESLKDQKATLGTGFSSEE